MLGVRVYGVGILRCVFGSQGLGNDDWCVGGGFESSVSRVWGFAFLV